VLKVGTVLIASMMLLLGPVGYGQDQPAAGGAFKVPDDLVAKSNPVKTTPEGLAHAKKMWGYDCAICHGANGNGKGEIASSMKEPMKDYTDPAALKGMSDGQLFYIIQKGKDEMPPEGDRGKPDDMWNLVALMRSFSGTK
jgi:mono/diheme cytochrome c family protein